MKKLVGVCYKPTVARISLKRLSIVLGILGFAAAVWANRTGQFSVKPFPHGGEALAVTSATQWPPTVAPVKMGMFLENVYDFNISTQSIAAELVVWLSWREDFQKLLDADGLSIEQVVMPINRVNSWDSVARPFYAKPLRRSDGSYYQLVRFGGRFYADVIDLHRYPFERVSFPLIFGFTSMSDLFTADKARLVPDTSNSGVGAYIDIIGFATDGVSLTEFIQKTPTNYGFAEQKPLSFSQVRMTVDYTKSGIAAFQQLILPLVIVMLIVLVAPNLAASLWDVRIAIPSTALLTLVFMQQGYRQTLPLLPYVTFLDQVYAQCYLVTFGLFCLFVHTSNKLDTTAEDERPAQIAKLNKLDTRMQMGFILFLVVGVTLNWFVPLK